MANILQLNHIDPYFRGERPSNYKFTKDVTFTMNMLVANQVAINTATDLLLQRASGGSEQAKITFFLAAAPTGWTRDSTFSSDQLLRVTDGTTVPPGISPIAAGGAEGGDWIITGLTTDSTGAHTHSLQTHTHTMGNHTHTWSSHTHTLSAHTHSWAAHTHTIGSGNMTLNTASPTDTAKQGVSGTGTTSSTHTHGGGSHSHSSPTGSAGAGTTSTPSSTDTAGTVPASDTPSTNTTASPSTDTSASEGAHSHSVSQGGLWRPIYVNVLVCKKD